MFYSKDTDRLLWKLLKRANSSRVKIGNKIGQDIKRYKCIYFLCTCFGLKCITWPTRLNLFSTVEKIIIKIFEDNHKKNDLKNWIFTITLFDIIIIIYSWLVLLYYFYFVTAVVISHVFTAKVVLFLHTTLTDYYKTWIFYYTLIYNEMRNIINYYKVRLLRID